MSRRPPFALVLFLTCLTPRLSAQSSPRGAMLSPKPASTPAPAEAPTNLSAIEGGDDQTDKIIASLTPPIPPEAINAGTLKPILGGFGSLPSGRQSGQDEAAVERLVRSQWPEAIRQEVRISYRDVSRFEVKIEYGTGLSTPQAYPFFFTGVPQGELKLKFVQFLGPGADADFPPADKAAQTLGVWVLPEKLKAREANDAVMAMVARAEARGLGALCISSPSEFTDFDYALITTSAKLPPAAGNEIDTLQRLRKFPGMAAYLAGLQVGFNGAPRKLPVFFATNATWTPFADNPRERKTVRLTRLTVGAAADSRTLSTANFILKVPGSAPERAKEWVHVSADWDNRQGLPGGARAAAATGVLALGNYFKLHPAPRSMVFTLLGGSVWGGAGADRFMTDWPKDETIYWHLTATALGRMEKPTDGGVLVPSNLLLLNGWSYSKSLKSRLSSVVNPFHEIARQYNDQDGNYIGDDKLDRQFTDLNGSFPALYRLRRGTTVIAVTGASPNNIDQTDGTVEKINLEQLADQVKAIGHYAQKLASPGA